MQSLFDIVFLMSYEVHVYFFPRGNFTFNQPSGCNVCSIPKLLKFKLQKVPKGWGWISGLCKNHIQRHLIHLEIEIFWGKWTHLPVKRNTGRMFLQNKMTFLYAHVKTKSLWCNALQVCFTNSGICSLYL